MSYGAKLKINGEEYPIASSLYGTCPTSGGTAAKVVWLPNFDALIEGVMVAVRFTYGNTAENPTLKVNSTDAKPIRVYGTTAPGTKGSTSWEPESVVVFVYSGGAWMIVSSPTLAIETLEESLADEVERATGIEANIVEQVGTKEPKKLVFYNTVVGVASTATATTSGTGITGATVNVSTFEVAIQTTGSYVFTFDGTNWYYNGTAVTLSNYGITVEGTPASGNTITVAYTRGTNAFVTNGTYADFPYRATVPLDGVTADMIPEVAFDIPEASSGIYAPGAVSYDGGIYLYATEVPSSSITIPVIICWKS